MSIRVDIYDDNDYAIDGFGAGVTSVDRNVEPVYNHYGREVGAINHGAWVEFDNISGFS